MKDRIVIYQLRDPYNNGKEIEPDPRCPKCGSSNVFFAEKNKKVVVQHLNQAVTYHTVKVRVGLCRDCWHIDHDDNFYR
jgi:hypothetical protein